MSMVEKSRETASYINVTNNSTLNDSRDQSLAQRMTFSKATAAVLHGVNEKHNAFAMTAT